MTQNQKNIVFRYSEILEMWPENVTDAVLAEILLQLAPEKVSEFEEAERIVAEVREGMKDGWNSGRKTMQSIKLEQPLDELMAQDLREQVPDEPARRVLLCAAYETLTSEMGMRASEAEMTEFRNLDEHAQWHVFARLLDRHSRKRAADLLGFAVELGSGRSMLAEKHIPVEESELALALAVWMEGDDSPRDVGEQSGRTRAVAEKIIEDGDDDPDYIASRIIGGLSLTTLGVLGFIKSEALIDALLAFSATIEGEVFVIIFNLMSAYIGLVILSLVVAGGLTMAGRAVADWRNKRKAPDAKEPSVDNDHHSAPDVSS